jgi:hypothetical protein
MTALNEILDGFGDEAITDRNGIPVAEYVNMGDTYTTTLVRKIDTGTIMITSFGDYAERNRI